MTDSPKYETFSSELESRLDELFQENDPPLKTARTGAHEDDPLTELKKAVLSIDWEITPASLASFQEQIPLLKKAHSNDKIALAFLQILENLGQYITASRSKVHPATFTVLNAVFGNLEEVLNAPNLEEGAKRRSLQAAVSAYQQLRHKIAQRREVRPPATAPVSAAGAEALGAGRGVTQEILQQVVQDLKDFIRSEIGLLKDQLRIESYRR